MPTSDSYEYQSDDGPVVRWASLDALARDWWASERAGLGGISPAWTLVEQLISDASSEAVALIQLLVDLADDAGDLATVGAGPLEDLVSHDGHGLHFLGELTTHARQDPRFSAAIRSVYPADDLPRPVLDMLAMWQR
jgi:hypothetical protein